MEGGGRDSGMFSPVWGVYIQFTSNFFASYVGAGDSCDWLLVPCSQKNPQASDTPTSKIFLTLLCGRSIRPCVWMLDRATEWWNVIVPSFTHTQWVENFRMPEENLRLPGVAVAQGAEEGRDIREGLMRYLNT